MKNRSLVTQLRITFFWILIASIVASLCTYLVMAILFERGLQNQIIQPENYYEKQIPEIEQYIREEQERILLPSHEEYLKNQIRLDEISYQVLDIQGNILYGNYSKKVVETKEQLLRLFNTTIRQSPDYIRIVPVLDENGTVQGAVLLVYPLDLSLANKGQKWLNIILMIVLLSPLFYMALFTFLFSRSFIKKITVPLTFLIEGVHQIQERNLEFEIPYYGKNELGELCSAFLEMKEELKNSLSKQWEMEQERVELVEALAHDLKSPLSVIKAYSEAIEDDTEIDDEQQQYLKVIEENIEKSIAIVQRMQESSELEHANVQLHLVDVDFIEFLNSKVLEYKVQARQQGIEVQLEQQGSIPSFIKVDVEKIERILDNLISNSLQYTKKGGQIKLLVRIEKNRIYYSICDSGIGFREEELKKVFDKFYRSDKARGTKGAHSGLGLYIVKHLVELMGGTIEVTNRQEGGACVRFWHKIEI